MAIIVNTEEIDVDTLTFDDLEHGILYVDGDGDLCFLVSNYGERTLVYHANGRLEYVCAKDLCFLQYKAAPNGVSLVITGD